MKQKSYSKKHAQLKSIQNKHLLAIHSLVMTKRFKNHYQAQGNVRKLISTYCGNMHILTQLALQETRTQNKTINRRFNTSNKSRIYTFGKASILEGLGKQNKIENKKNIKTLINYFKENKNKYNR